MGILLELTRKYHRCIWSMVTVHKLDEKRKWRKWRNSSHCLYKIYIPTRRPRTFHFYQCCGRTSWLYIPTSIGVSQEVTTARTVKETLTNIVGNTNGVTVAALGDIEEKIISLVGRKTQNCFSKNSGMFCKNMLYFS